MKEENTMRLKPALYLTLLTILIASPAYAQESIEGHWQGALIRGGAVQVISVDFVKDGAGLSARIETPDLVIAERPPSPATLQNGKIQFNTPFGKATLSIDGPMGEMLGTVGETTPPIQIHLKRAFKPAVVPFNTVDVQFRNGDVTLAGTLVTPATAGPHPVVIRMHGRGKSTRNDFRGLARILAQRGIASLIYDKRGVGQSTGDHDKSGMYDFAGDALAAVEFVAARPEIDRQQIGLHGNSAGGWVAAIVANRTKFRSLSSSTTLGRLIALGTSKFMLPNTRCGNLGLISASRSMRALVNTWDWSRRLPTPARWRLYVPLLKKRSRRDGLASSTCLSQRLMKTSSGSSEPV